MAPAKVLIVDDDAIIRTLLRHALGTEPLLLLEAADGQQALEMVNREKPDLILLDIMMPLLDGRAVLRRLQAQEHTRHIPVIFVTALNEESEVVASLDEGAVDHICKPFSEYVVRARVRAALRHRGFGTDGSPRRKRIGFIGAKGGVGVTTAVVNTALSMIGPHRSVIAVELHACPGTLSHQLGVRPTTGLQTLLDHWGADGPNGVSVNSCLMRHLSGLQVLLAPPAMDSLREITVAQAEGILSELTKLADYAIIDLPFPPTQATVAALRCCDFIVLAIELEATCLASAQTLLKGLLAWGVDPNAVGAMLILREPTVGTLINVEVARARAQLTCGLIGLVPSAGERNLVALRNGTPLVLSAPDSVVAMAYMEIGARLMADPITTRKL